jgi:hypothetical protein
MQPCPRANQPSIGQEPEDKRSEFTNPDGDKCFENLQRTSSNNYGFSFFAAFTV